MSKTALNYYSYLIKSLKYKYRGKIENRNRNKKRFCSNGIMFWADLLSFLGNFIFPNFDV
jgi:hypothetical protein